MNVRTLAVAALLALASPALAQTPNACMDVPISAGVEALTQAGATNVVFLQGDSLTRAVAVYNSVPPEDDAKWPLALLADLPGGGGFLAVGRGAVFCGRLMVPPEHWEGLKRSVLGAAA